MTFTRTLTVAPRQSVRDAATQLDTSTLDVPHLALLEAGLIAASQIVEDSGEHPTEIGATVTVMGWDNISGGQGGSIGLNLTIAVPPKS